MAMPMLVETDNEFLPIGTKLFNDAFEITGHLGRGGFGQTYLAVDGLKRSIVIKECYPRNLCVRNNISISLRSRVFKHDYEKVVANFVREAQAMARLSHPNIASVYQLFEENDTAYMALEFIEGNDLSKRLKTRQGPMEPEEVITIATQLLQALSYMHDNKLLHRDIAPDNIILREDGTPVLIDFGAARGDGGKVTRLLSEQLSVVKDGYSPQEFYIPDSEQTPASDLYALAATLYHAVTGKAPTDCNVRMLAVAQSEPDPIEPVAGRVQGYPRGFLEALDQALNIFPARRIQKAQDWLDRFDKDKAAKPKGMMYRGVSLDETGDAPAEASSTPASSSDEGGRKKMVLLGAVGVIAVLAGVGVFGTGGSDPVAKPAPEEVAVASGVETREVTLADTPVSAEEPVQVAAAETQETIEVTADPLALPVLAPVSQTWTASIDWSLIPRSDADGNPILSFLGASRNPFPDGTQLLKIGAFETPEAPEDVKTFVETHLNRADPAEAVVPLTIRDPFTGKVDQTTLSVEAFKVADFPTFQLTQKADRRGWTTFVSEVNGAAFEVGDTLRSERGSQLSLATIDDVTSMLSKLAKTGNDLATVMVLRDGRTEVVKLPTLLD